MRVVVTGASGFVGRPTCAALAARGDRIVALTRRPDAADGLPAGAERVAWQASAGPPPADALAGADAVVNLAGESIAQRWTAERKRAIRESRVAGTRHLVDAIAAAATPPRVLVSASAVGFYGDRGDETVTEDSAPGSGFLAEVCRAWEAEASRAESYGVRVVRLRLGVVLARGGGALGRMLLPFRLGLGGPIGSGRQWLSWIHRDDVVGLILHALETTEASGPLNATAPDPVRNAEFARALATALGRPAVLPVPAFALRLALGEMAAMLLEGQRAVPARTEAIGYAFAHPGLEPALRAIVGRD